MARLPGLLSESGRKLVRAEGVRLGPPVARPGKIICLGKNYADHAMEFDSKVPQTPILFSKAATAVTGPYDPICLPPDAEIVDLEAELAVVIGREARCVPEDRALDYIVGYTILNDVTDRVAQRTDGQWFRSKSLDTFCPLGPWLVTPDEAGDPGNLRVESKLNGVILQNGNTADMIFKIPFLIAYISATITLLPGDVIATGTPAGIGWRAGLRDLASRRYSGSGRETWRQMNAAMRGVFEGTESQANVFVCTETFAAVLWRNTYCAITCV